MDNGSLSIVLSIAAVVLAPLAGLAVAIITDHRSKQQTKLSYTAEEKNIDIREQEAETHYFAAITEGFVEQLRLVNNQYDRLSARYTDLEAKHTALEARFTEIDKQRAELLKHVEALEALVPTPPGPPPRPWNKKTFTGSHKIV